MILFQSREILFVAGVVTSPNYPVNYPNNLLKTETIQVEEGLIVLIQFTAFNLPFHSYCGFDHLTITDGDGTILMEKSCGSSDDGTAAAIGGQIIGSSLPADIRSRSNTVNFMFKTDYFFAMSGWSVSWSAVTPGKGSVQKPQSRP